MRYFWMCLLSGFLCLPAIAEAPKFMAGVREAGMGMTHMLFPTRNDVVVEVYVSGDEGRYEQFHVTFFSPFEGNEIRKEEFVYFLETTSKLSGIPTENLHKLVMTTMDGLKNHHKAVAQRRLPLLDTEYFQEDNWLVFGRTGLNPKEGFRINHFTIKGFRIDSELLQKSKLNVFQIENAQ